MHTHRSVAEILHLAHQLNGFPDQARDVGQRRGVEVRTVFRRRVLLENVRLVMMRRVRAVS